MKKFMNPYEYFKNDIKDNQKIKNYLNKYSNIKKDEKSIEEYFSNLK